MDLSKKIGLFVSPLLFVLMLLMPPQWGLKPDAWRVLAMAIFMLGWWVTEAMPLPVTSLVPLVLLPLLGISESKQVATFYGDPIVFLFLGGFLALTSGWLFAAIYAASAVLFWLYSSPHARWKGKPWLSFIAIGLSTGTASVLMGRLAAGPLPLGTGDVVASVAVALVLLSLYPLSQIYQLSADRRRGDETFALKFGLKGVKLGFVAFYISGLMLLSLSFFITGLKPLAAALLVLGLAWGFGIGFRLRPLQGKESEYDSVMRLKYTTSAIFVFLLVGAIAWKHGALL